VDRKTRILHVIDDKKFLVYCERTFSLSDLENTYCSAKDFKKYITENIFDIVVVHYLTEESITVLNSVNIRPPVIWFFWGSDAFCLGRFYNRFLLPKTKYIRLKLSFKKGILNGLVNTIKLILPTLVDRRQYYQELIKSFEKVAIVVPIVPDDFKLLYDNYCIKSTPFHLSYINPVFDLKNPFDIQGDDILVGNSASLSNNHIEIIDILSKANIYNNRIVIPLSYGDKVYASYVERYAKKKLRNVCCLTNFLPFSEYQNIIESCSIIIMNHLRQQALGNIVQALLSGAHLYMQPSSTVSKYLKENNFYFSNVNSNLILRPLTADERKVNRDRCIEVFGKETQHAKVAQLIQKALQL